MFLKRRRRGERTRFSAECLFVALLEANAAHVERTAQQNTPKRRKLCVMRREKQTRPRAESQRSSEEHSALSQPLRSVGFLRSLFSLHEGLGGPLCLAHRWLLRRFSTRYEPSKPSSPAYSSYLKKRSGISVRTKAKARASLEASSKRLSRSKRALQYRERRAMRRHLSLKAFKTSKPQSDPSRQTSRSVDTSTR